MDHLRGTSQEISLKELELVLPSTEDAASKTDPMQSFPPEISLQILEYLRPNEVWRLRTVSRAWNNRLRDSSAERIALLNHETHHPSDQLPNVQRTLNNRRQLLKAHHLGRPVGIVPLSPVPAALLPQWNTGRSHVSPALKGRYWAHGLEDKSVRVVDLSTTAVIDLHVNSRIFALTLSEEILAVVTEYELFYWKLEDLSQPPKAFALQQAIYKCCSDKHMIALWCQFGSGDISDNPGLIVMDTRTHEMRVHDVFFGRTETLRILPRQRQIVSVLLSADDLACDIIAHRDTTAGIHFGRELKQELQVIRIDLASRQCKELFVEYTLTAGCRKKFYQQELHVQPSGNRRQWFVYVKRGESSYIHQMMLQLDNSGAVLSLLPCTGHSTALWKGNFYSSSRRGIRVDRVRAFNEPQASLHSWIEVKRRHAGSLFVNESFLIEYFRGCGGPENKYTVYTFDTNLQSTTVNCWQSKRAASRYGRLSLSCDLGRWHCLHNLWPKRVLWTSDIEIKKNDTDKFEDDFDCYE